jgi:hypothetical protein
MRTRNPQRPGRPSRYDPEQIRELLDRRDREGVSWRRLSFDSGVSVSALQYWSRRRTTASSSAAGFVELAVSDTSRQAPSELGSHIEIVAPSGLRILVPNRGEVVREILGALLAGPC